VDSVWLGLAGGLGILVVSLVLFVPLTLFSSLANAPVLAIAVVALVALSGGGTLFSVVWVKRVPLIAAAETTESRRDLFSFLPREIWLLLGSFITGGVLGDGLYYVATSASARAVGTGTLWSTIVRLSVYIFVIAATRNRWLRLGFASMALSGVLVPWTPLGRPSIVAWLLRRVLTLTSGIAFVIAGWAVPRPRLWAVALLVLLLGSALRLSAYYLYFHSSR
jgi:hypothetical protein